MDERTLEAARTRASALCIQERKPYTLKQDGDNVLYVVSLAECNLYPGKRLVGETFHPVIALDRKPRDPVEKVEKVAKVSPYVTKADL